MHNLRSIPRIIHVQDRNINYYVKNNNSDTQCKNKYKKTYSCKQIEKKNNDNDAFSQRLQSVTKPRSWLRFASSCWQSISSLSESRRLHATQTTAPLSLYAFLSPSFSPCNLCNPPFLKTDFVYLSITNVFDCLNPAHSENALFPFLVWVYREQCMCLYVKSPYINLTYVFQQNIDCFQEPAPAAASSSSIVAHFIPTFQITRIKNIQLFPNWLLDFAL